MEKLRNKKTGVIVKFLSLELVDEDEIEFTYEMLSGHEKAWSYNSLEKFKEEWEIYKPAEPLIKDKNIRNAVRAWAKANGVDKAILGQVNNDELVKKSPMTAFGCHISFEGSLGLERGRNYTVTELCGEGEE